MAGGKVLFKYGTLSNIHFSQFSSVGQLCPTLCNPMNCSMPGINLSPHANKILRKKIFLSIISFLKEMTNNMGEKTTAKGRCQHNFECWKSRCMNVILT